jgi:hypothetical protein
VIWDSCSSKVGFLAAAGRKFAPGLNIETKKKFNILDKKELDL